MKNKNKPILITKASGQVLPFSEEKLISSLLRSGADPGIAATIVSELMPQLYDGVSTRKIYQWAFRLLKEKSKTAAGRYHLKNGIMELGPSGFPFEVFVSEILKEQGHTTRVGQIVKGHCVNHEIDIIAEMGEQHFMIECKYHNRPGTVCDVKIPLYIQARFKDVEASWVQLPGHENKFHQGWVVTNTRFTGDAIQYGKCSGLKLIGWNYPNGGSLRSLVDKSGLYPITCLTSLSKGEKNRLLEKNIVLCREICQNENLLLEAGVKVSRVAHIINEGKQLCKSATSHPKEKKN